MHRLRQEREQKVRKEEAERRLKELEDQRAKHAQEVSGRNGSRVRASINVNNTDFHISFGAHHSISQYCLISNFVDLGNACACVCEWSRCY